MPPEYLNIIIGNLYGVVCAFVASIVFRTGGFLWGMALSAVFVVVFVVVWFGIVPAFVNYRYRKEPATVRPPGEPGT